MVSRRIFINLKRPPVIRRSRHILVLLLIIYHSAGAADTTMTLGREQFLGIVRTYHPVMKQAALQVERARAEVLAARGAFDPALNTTADRKTFDGKLYYSYFHPQLTIPTWYGIDLKAGIEEVLGDRVTSEATLGKTSYVGVKLPANNLLFDKRRAVLRQAQNYKQVSEAEQMLMINDLLYDALNAYWNWVKAYFDYRVVSEAVAVNEERLKYVRIEYEQGSRAAIDTTEVSAQLQSFYLQQNANRVGFQNAGLELSNYLWMDNNTPVEWQETIIPPEADLAEQLVLPGVEALISSAMSSHPKLQSLSFKTGILETERKLKAQYLLPKLSLNANLLSRGYVLPNDYSSAFLQNNYKVGVDLSIPLLLREARGNYRSAGIKLREINLEQDMVSLQIENKIKSYYNEVMQTGRQITIFEQAVANYQKLLQGEKIKFEAGESTLFLLNARENKMLEATQKLYELRTKWHKSYAALIWSAGQLS